MLRNNPEKDLGLGTCVGAIAGSPKALHPNLGAMTSIQENAWICRYNMSVWRVGCCTSPSFWDPF